MELPLTPRQSFVKPCSLPFGNTLHYSGCGCPLGWVPGCRACDLVDSFLQQAFLGVRNGLLTPLRKLRVLFCLPHHNITGGMKMLLEQIRLLRQRGHYVIAAMRSDTAPSALPPWTDVGADEDVVCRLSQRMDEACDMSGVDVVVVGIFHQVAEWLAVSPAPVLYWEQGHEFLFGDPVRLQEVHNYRRQDQLFHRALHLPVALAAVSEAVQSILSQEFGRTSLLIHNGIDCQRFRPGQRSQLEPTTVLTASNYQEPPVSSGPLPSVLLVGNPLLPLKGFDVVIATLAMVNQVQPIEVTWVCQSKPTEQEVPGLSTCGLKINLHVSPSQADLPSLYRGHDCLLFCSRYEAWGMPVLEAMASGLAVVTTNCLGVTAFAQPGVNCFMAAPQDVLGLARGVLAVLGQPSVRHKLQAAARQTAELFSPTSVAEQLETVLYSLTVCTPELLQLRQASALDIQASPCSRLTSVLAAQACARTPEQQQLCEQYAAQQALQLEQLRLVHQQQQQQQQQQPLLLPPLVVQQQAGGVPPRLSTASSGDGTAAVPPVTEAGEPHPPTPSQGLWRPLSQNPLQLGLGQLQPPLGAGAKGWVPHAGVQEGRAPSPEQGLSRR
ncbi:hypothetical protein N2152v2_004208 [Parachlorella kessleri]